jgi:hypothetical protein
MYTYIYSLLMHRYTENRLTSFLAYPILSFLDQKKMLFLSDGQDAVFL